MNPWGTRSARKRDRLRIIAEILEITKVSALKTHILYQANLSFTQVNDYLKLMLEANLLNKVKKNDKYIYSATKKGLDFLPQYQELTELLRTEKENCRINVKMPSSHLMRNVNSVVYVSKSHHI